MSSTGGWYPDPHDPGRVRWWDGKWTNHVQDDPRLAPRPEELVATPAAAPMAAPVAAAMAPAPAPAPAAPIEPAPAPAAPSIGGALLPPLSGASPGDGVPPPPPFPTGPAPPDLLEPGARKGASLRMLLFAVGLVAVALALMLVVSGVVQFGTSEGGDDPTFEVYEGPAYTVEVPRVWEQLETPASANIDASFRTSQGGLFTIGSAEGDVAALADPAARSAAVDLIVRVQLAAYPQVQVARREPLTLDGAPAERVTLEGVTPEGQPVRVTQVIAVQDGLLVFLGVEGAPEALSADAIALEHAIATFELT